MVDVSRDALALLLRRQVASPVAALGEGGEGGVGAVGRRVAPALPLPAQVGDVAAAVPTLPRLGKASGLAHVI